MKRRCLWRGADLRLALILRRISSSTSVRIGLAGAIAPALSILMMKYISHL